MLVFLSVARTERPGHAIRPAGIWTAHCVSPSAGANPRDKMPISVGAALWGPRPAYSRERERAVRCRHS